MLGAYVRQVVPAICGPFVGRLGRQREHARIFFGRVTRDAKQFHQPRAVGVFLRRRPDYLGCVFELARIARRATFHGRTALLLD